MTPNKSGDQFCGKEYHKYLYLIVVLAVIIMIGGYWFNQYGDGGSPGRANRVQGGGNSPGGNSPGGNSPEIPAPVAGMPGFQGGGNVQSQQPRSVPVAQQPAPDLLAQDPSLLARPAGFAAVVRSMMPSVVNISAHSDSPPQAQAAGPRGPELPQAPAAPSPGGLQFANPFSGVSQESIGSGIIVTEEGHVLTNYHVVENSKNVVVLVYHEMGDKSFFADVVARDNSRDLALLLIEPAGKLKPAPLGNSEGAQIGDSVITIGSPFGLNHSVSKGIVSGKRKVVNIGGVLHKGLLQTDAAINRGNSGGPLVDGRGWVIGVNTAIYTTTSAFSGVGFAVPSNSAREFLEDWITLPNVQPDLSVPVPVAGGAHIAVRPPPPIQANATPPHGDRGPCANCHDILPGPQPVGFATVAAPRQTTAPPIRADARLPHDDWGPCANCHPILPSTQPVAFGVGPGPGLHQQPGRGMGQGIPGKSRADDGNFDAMQQFSFSPGGAIGVTVAGVGGNDSSNSGTGMTELGVTWSMLDATSAGRLRVSVPFGVVVSAVEPGTSGETMGIRVGDVVLKADGRWLKTPDQVNAVFARIGRGEVVRLLVHREGMRVELDASALNVGGQPPAATWLPVAGQQQPLTLSPQQPSTLQPQSMMLQQPWGMSQPPGGQVGVDSMVAAGGQGQVNQGQSYQGQTGGAWTDFPGGVNSVGPPAQKAAPPPTEFEWMGMEMIPMDQAAWQRNPELKGKYGGLVTDTDPGAQAERAGIRRGDLVVAVNGLPVATPQALDGAIKAVKGQTGVLVEIERMNQRMFATLQ